MVGLSVLVIGGTGRISTSVVREAVRQGMDVTVLNRSRTSERVLPEEVTRLTADVSDPQAVRDVVGDQEFDAVVNWVNFTPEQVKRDIDLFGGRCGQYLFISSASAYQTPPSHLPVVESTPLKNPYWQYSRDKIACEELLVDAYRDDDFPVTIVRPSHTYDETMLPFDGGWTVVERMRAGKPVIVHGDGTSLWTITHSRDFAVGFVGLLGKADAIGEPFHITGDEAPTWNQIFTWVAEAAGVAEPNLVHVPSDAIAAADPNWGAGLLGDKAHSMVFDNSKIKRLVPEFGRSTTPYRLGAREVIAWYDAHADHRVADPETGDLMDWLAETYAPLPR
ncbi:SDR family oxidoreductase [Glycomyces buryatensis]|uniref:SDR family oxidoreductase n=1 Tax=Glycomyces buryatensis TaxID=2570927 RepID=A0A4S8QDL6_9ACTN|nr:SDR family oxidoreductase [Glycomyces buryatensis]THV42478.1 SDR family oxidoreductase [Glycomyces buryatensis]